MEHFAVKPRPWWERVADFFFVPTCPGCGRVGYGFCVDCAADIVPLRLEYLDYCHVYCGGYYVNALRQAILDIKYKSYTYLLYAVSLRMLYALPDYILRPGVFRHRKILCVPIPTTPQRLRQRGFHCAGLLARQLVWQVSNLTYAPHALGMTMQAREQKKLTRFERFANTQGVYQATSLAQEQYILLVDDVMTTGATIMAAVAALYAAGANRVDVCVAGLAYKHQS